MKQWAVHGRSRALVVMVVLGLVASVTTGSLPTEAAEAPPGFWPWAESGQTFRIPLTVVPSADGGALYVTAEVDFTAAMQQAESFGEAFDPGSLIVNEVDGDGAVLASEVPFQFDEGQGYDATTSAHGELVLEVAAPTVVDEARIYLVYFDTQQGGAAGATVADQVVMESDVADEGMSAISVGTATGTWWYQTEAGGFSSLIDVDGTDWIGWSSAVGAAGEFRGIPNLVYPAGYFHPGATGHTTTLGADGPLRVSFNTVSPDGRWEMRWEIYPDGAIAEVVRSDGAYWFMYEGTPGGAVEPNSDFWAQSTGASATLDTTFDADIPTVEWVQFGDPQSDRSLLVVNHTDDSSPDSYFTLDGQMTVFGFGRSGLVPSLSGTERRFWVGLLESAHKQPVAASANSRMADPEISVGIAQNSLPDTTPPVITSTPTVTAGQNHLEVSWGTDEFALSELSIGTDPQLDVGTYLGDPPGVSHTIRATGLTCDTLYHWAVTSTDTTGNTVSSPTEQARTAPCDQELRVGGELVLYDFVGGSGSTVFDRSLRGTGLDLTISDPAKASWGADGLTVSGATIRSAGAASKVISGVGATDEITVEAWVTPASVTQGGPARIVSIAPNPYSRNVMLGQASNTFSGRVRTTTNFGLATFFTNPGTATPSLTHVVLTRDSAGVTTLYVNGVDAGSTTWAGSFANWDPGFPLVLGNVADGSRPWNGTLCLVAIYDQALTASEVAGNHDAGCATTPHNTAPTLDPIADQDSLVSDSVLLAVSAQDSDGDDLSFSAVGLPPGLGIDAETGTVSGAFDGSAVAGSPYSVTVTVDDSHNEPVTRTFTWTVRDQELRVGGELVLYDFVGGSGSTVFDRSLRGTGLDLTISDPAKASWGADGLTVSGATIRSAGAASKVISGVGATDEITVEAWVTPASVTQGGPARIVSIAPNPYSRNVMLGQGGWGSLPSNTFSGRVRTTTNFGQPTFFTNPGTATPSLTHVVLTRDSAGVTTLYVNGVDAGSTTWAGSFANWDPGFPLVLGNVADGSRPWNGTLCLVAIYDQALTASEVAGNHDAGCATTPHNTAPTLDPIADQDSLVSDSVLLAVSAQDSDGDDLSFSAVGLPPGLGIDAETGTVSGAFDGSAVAGSPYSVTVTVDDSHNEPVTRTFTWTVRDQELRVGGELVLYDFVGGSGSTVFDRSLRGTGLDLTISDPAKASWGADGLTVSGATIRSAGAASKVISGVGATDEITVEAWVTPASVTQGGPARIVSIAPNPYSRNVMLGQASNTFSGRVRTTTNFGLATFFTNPGTATPSLTHVVLTRDSAGVTTLYVNGVDAGSTTWAGSFANWDPGFPLVLGNVADGSRPWNGTLCLVAIYDQALTASEVAGNHDAGCATTPHNTAPLATGDSFELAEDGTLTVDAATGVLANDTDPEQNPLTAALISNAVNGNLALGSDGSFTYTPAPDYAGVDSFTYQADDGTNRSETTTVALTVHPVDDPTIARDDAYSTRPHAELSVPAANGVLANDTDVDQDPLSAILVDDVTNGSLSLSSDGAFVYVPDPGFVGVDGFTYEADSGAGPPSTAHVVISVSGTNKPPVVTTGSVRFTNQLVDDEVDDTHCAEAADLDGDGDMDVIATDYIDDTVFWYDNDGAGGFTSRILDSNLDGAYPCGAADLDMDGDVDVLAAGYLADTYVWYENNGSASFTRRVIDGAADGAHSIVAADMDGDGDNDLLAANQDASTVTWYQNDGTQGFSLRTIDSAASGAKRAEAGDMDGDGDLDVVAASFFDNTVAWHRNDGSGNFTKVLIDTSTIGAYYVALADADGDNDLDVFTASQLDNTVAWHRNGGSGTFTKHLIDGGAAGARSVAAGDIDGDGDVDAVGNSVDRGTVSWYENDGTQGFSTKVVDPIAPGAYGVALADFDRNGLLDVLAANRDARTVTLHRQGRAHTASVDAGGSYSIGPSKLSASDSDSTPEQLVYSLDAAPRHGALVIDGLALPVGGTFTQDDVDQLRVSYLHGGSSVANDQFELSLTDGSSDAGPIRVFFDVSVADPNALIAHLRLDEASGTAAADATGNGHTGTLLGGATFDADTPDGSTSAVRLDGMDDSIGLAPVDVDGSGLTVATWFKPNSFGVSDARLVSKASGTAANEHVFMLSTFKSGDTTVLRARVRVDGTTTTLIAPVGALLIGQWQHGALTHDGSMLRLYLNGGEVASKALGGPVDLAPALGVGVGDQPAGAGSRPFHGLIDDVRIYRQPLSPDEVNALASTLP